MFRTGMEKHNISQLKFLAHNVEGYEAIPSKYISALNNNILMNQLAYFSNPSNPESQYQIISYLDSGAYSKLYKVQDLKANKEYALKLSSSRSNYEAEIIELIKKNCNTFQGVVKLYDYWTQEPYFYQIIELGVDNLFVHYQKNQPYYQQKKNINRFFQQTAQGLVESAKLNIMHRDLKPENIIVFQEQDNQNEFCFKISDFGCSKQDLGPTQRIITYKVGTAYYMAPEMIREQGEYNTKVDVWSLGCVWYFVANGNDLFSGPTTSDVFKLIEDATQEIINQKVSQITSIDEEYKQLMRQMLQISHTQRIDALNLIKQLELIQQGKPTMLISLNPQSIAIGKNLSIKQIYPIKCMLGSNFSPIQPFPKQAQIPPIIQHFQPQVSQQRNYQILPQSQNDRSQESTQEISKLRDKVQELEAKQYQQQILIEEILQSNKEGQGNNNQIFKSELEDKLLEIQNNFRQELQIITQKFENILEKPDQTLKQRELNQQSNQIKEEILKAVQSLTQIFGHQKALSEFQFIQQEIPDSLISKLKLRYLQFQQQLIQKIQIYSTQKFSLNQCKTTLATVTTILIELTNSPIKLSRYNELEQELSKLHINFSN